MFLIAKEYAGIQLRGKYNMAQVSLPSNCLLPQLDLGDYCLLQGPEASSTERVEQRCSATVRTLLSRCDWSVITQAEVTTLTIACPDAPTNWQLLYHVPQLGQAMAQFSKDARICIFPPLNTGIPFEIRVDELPVYVD